MKLSLGIFQSEMRDETPLEKISRLERHLSKTGNLDLVVCPELFISGYGSSININKYSDCLLYTSPSPRDVEESRMPSSA